MDINELKDAILSTLGQVTGRAAGVTDKAVGTVKSGGRIARLAMDAATAREEVKKTYLEIGKLYYDTHKDDPEGFFIQLFEEVRVAEEDIAAKEAELSALRESLRGTAPAEEKASGDGFERVVDAAEDKADAFAETVTEAEAEADAAEAAEEAKNNVADKVQAIRETVQEKAGVVKDVVVEKAGIVKDTVVEKVGVVKDTVVEKAGVVKDAVTAKIAEVRGAAEEKAEEAAESFEDVVGKAEDAAADAVEKAEDVREGRREAGGKNGGVIRFRYLNMQLTGAPLAGAPLISYKNLIESRRPRSAGRRERECYEGPLIRR